LSVRRKIRDEVEAVRLLSAVERSGLSAREWARAHGVDGRSLNAWHMNIARRGTRKAVRPRRRKQRRASATHALVELVPATSPVAQQVGAGRYVLEIGGARVEFGDDVSVATLRRVLEALRLC